MKRLKKNLADDIRKHNGHLTTGNIATKYMLEALSDNDMGDLAFEIATQRIIPAGAICFQGCNHHMGALGIRGHGSHEFAQPPHVLHDKHLVLQAFNRHTAPGKRL